MPRSRRPVAGVPAPCVVYGEHRSTLRLAGDGRVAGDELGKRLLVGVGDGDILLAKDDAVAVDHLDFAPLHDKRAVHPYELTLGQHLFERLETQQREDGVWFAFEINLYIVLQAFDVENFVEGYLLEFVVALDKDIGALCRCGCRGAGGTVPLGQLEPLQRLLGGLEKIGIGDGLEQVVDGIDLVAVYGILSEGGGKDDATAPLDHVRELHAVEFGHLYVEEDEVDVALRNPFDRLHCRVERGFQLQEGGALDITLQQLYGQGFVVDNAAFQYHSLVSLGLVQIDGERRAVDPCIALGMQRVLAGIEQFELSREVFEPDARAAFVVLVFGEAAVLDAALDDTGRGFAHDDGHKRGFGGAGAVLEGILDEGDEEQRRNLVSAAQPPGHIDLDLHVAGEPQPHQLDVVVVELQLFLHGYIGLGILIKHVTQHLAQLEHGTLRPVGADGDERVDVVEGIEEEVRVELVLQVLQLGLGALLLQLLALLLGDNPLLRHLDGYAQSHHQSQGDGILPLHEPRPWRTRTARPPEQELVGDNHAVYQIDGHIGYHDEQHVVEDKLYRLFTEQHPVDKPQIVDVEDDRDADGLDIELHEAEVAYAPHTLEPLDEEEREEKDNRPCNGMDEEGIPSEAYMLPVGCHVTKIKILSI